MDERLAVALPLLRRWALGLGIAGAIAWVSAVSALHSGAASSFEVLPLYLLGEVGLTASLVLAILVWLGRRVA